ncbi:uncharacterized protein BX663DRAFT_493954 [Cokeromyces recurvatus]|uniref:uncharacterized protein n=1 Tax=Cokeromyces recurvatus TaxID=90255 RepID=UPI0022202E40|nr:uncharacterized protein BX663DRAFT_493954 [Cokeromyces recurvatus]KAI7906834.1 hypothetical protein BX663DRAFT_493954 [Cokeromyces recurvatus]
MFPVQRGLYGHRSTMSQFAKPGYSFMAFDPFPFTNANLTDFSVPNKSPLMQYPSSTDELYDQEISKESSNNSLPPKKPLTKAERRAEHNAIERARRENLNSKFQSLAQALPNLINYRRPSKSQIVEKAFDWVKQSISREERYRYQILQLQRENKRLLAQLMHYQHQQQQQPEEGGHAKYPMANNPIPTICTPHASTTTTTIMSTSPPASIPMYSNLNPPTPPPQSLTFTATSTTTLSTSASPTYAPVNSSMNANTNNNGWSTNPYLMNPTLQMNHYNNSTEDITKQDFANSKSDDDDNTSSGNEDDTDYQSSPNGILNNNNIKQAGTN